MGRSASYIVVEKSPSGAEPLIIKDVGPWDQHPTVTNDAENVVRELIRSRQLKQHQRLLCYDSDGQLDEILIADGRFFGFAPVDLKEERS